MKMQEAIEANTTLHHARTDKPYYTRPSYRFAAYLGDLEHKKDVALHFGVVNPETQVYLSNAHQAEWLRVQFPHLVPPPAQPDQIPSDHTLGTIFEYQYQCNPSFRVAYLDWLPLGVGAVVVAKLLVWAKKRGLDDLAAEIVALLSQPKIFPLVEGPD